MTRYSFSRFIHIEYHFHFLHLSSQFISFFSSVYFSMDFSSSAMTKTPTRNIDDGTDNNSYTRSLSDIPMSHSDERGKLDVNIQTRATSASAAPFSNIFKVPTNMINSPKSIGTPSSINSSNHQRRSTGTGPFERQLSLLDPMSDRVSTILVWQNLTVQIREDKRKEVIQRMKSYKTFVPKRKCLLNNISGAITGGVWAVMGELIAFEYKIYQYFQVHLVLANRLY